MKNQNKMIIKSDIHDSVHSKIHCSLCKVKDTEGINYCGVEICADCISAMNKKLKEEV